MPSFTTWNHQISNLFFTLIFHSNLQLHFFYKRLNFFFLFLDVFQFLHALMQLLKRVESISYYFYWLNLLLLFVFYQLGRLYTWSNMIRIHFITFVIQQIAQSKKKLLPFMNFSNTVWCLERSDWKSSSITSFTLSLIIISLVSFFKCITSILKINKLIVIINWTLRMSNFSDPLQYLLSMV